MSQPRLSRASYAALPPVDRDVHRADIASAPDSACQSLKESRDRLVRPAHAIAARLVLPTVRGLRCGRRYPAGTMRSLRIRPSSSNSRSTCLRPGQVALPAERLRRGWPSRIPPWSVDVRFAERWGRAAGQRGQARVTPRRRAPCRLSGPPNPRADAPPAVRARVLRSPRKLHSRSLHLPVARLARRCHPAVLRSR